MELVNAADRTLSLLDFSRLTKLRLSGGHADLLEDLLGEAEVLEAGELPADLVTLYAHAEIEHLPTQQRQQLVLCIPGQAEPGLGHVSVLSPIGMALLGLRVGATARWRSPSGEDCAARLIAVAPSPAQHAG